MRILVAGLINLETTLRIDAPFPIVYAPVRYPFFGVQSSVSGVGYNLAKSLTILGDEVRFLSLIGTDPVAELVFQALQCDQIASTHVLALLNQTAQSVILYEPSGKRMIHTDLKDIQERFYPSAEYDRLLEGCKLAVLSNINFTRHLLERTRSAEVMIATDIHAIANLDDDYNRDYMAAADILFMSHERLPLSPEDWTQAVLDRYPNVQILGMGLGADGALLAVRADGFLGRFAARQVRPIVSTIGAGDALFSSFLHGYLHTKDPYLAMQKAILFAAYKIGVAGAADGFLNATDLEALYQAQQNV